MSRSEAEVFGAFRAIGASRRGAGVGELKRDMLLLRWMVGGLYALMLPGLWLLVCVGAQVDTFK